MSAYSLTLLTQCLLSHWLHDARVGVDFPGLGDLPQVKILVVSEFSNFVFEFFHENVGQVNAYPYTVSGMSITSLTMSCLRGHTNFAKISSHYPFKWSVSQDFWPPVFIMIRTHLGPWLDEVFSDSVLISSRYLITKLPQQCGTHRKTISAFCNIPLR